MTGPPLRIVRGLVATTACIIGVACATSGTSGGGGAGADQLTADQLRAAVTSPDETLYQTLARIRPHWLIAAEGAPEPTVFIDGIQTGAAATLQVIAARAVESVRFLTPRAAASRYGSGMEGSVIDVTLAPAEARGPEEVSALDP